ncbi:hypothetical protein [Parasphingorhabdus sp.]
MKKSFFLAGLLLFSAPGFALPEVQPKESDSHAVSQDPTIAEFWQLMQAELAPHLEEFNSFMVAEYERAFTPTGPKESDWTENGVDMPAYLDTLPGGVSGNALQVPGATPSLEFFGSIPAGILADWEIVWAGETSQSPQDSGGGSFVAIGKRHVVFIGNDSMIKTNNGYCTEKEIFDVSTLMRVYRDRRFPFDLSDDETIEIEAEAMVMHHLFKGIETPRFCVIYRHTADDRIKSHTYNESGQPLGNIDADEKPGTIVQDFDLRAHLTSQFDFSFLDAEDESEGSK